ncbi:alpha-isopropylmalate synthase regulatory domain-containing protein [Streptomyces sp. NPDC051453]|uniref:alpha-isopropylmalate synthase regulatory domain-containing protein n=1 Tax=Streptomyces sp. NPDC051453 TaxID=3154941 RepID=UPI0034480C10
MTTEYVDRRSPLVLKESTTWNPLVQAEGEASPAVSVEALLVNDGGLEIRCREVGPSIAAAFTAALTSGGHDVRLDMSLDHQVTGKAGPGAAAYAQVSVWGTPFWGVGLGQSVTEANLEAVLAAVNRALALRP